MLRNLLLGLLFAASFSTHAFTREECNTIAVNIFYAQTMLNEDPVLFEAVRLTLEANPPEALDWTEKMKKAIMGMAKILKPGNNPQAVGEMVYKGCVNTKET